MSEQPKRTIKIIGGGDGRVDRTWRVVDAETGQHFAGVRRVELIADARGVGEAILYIHPMGVEVEIEATIAEVRADELTAAERVAGEVEKRVHEQIARLFERLFGSRLIT